MYLLFLNLNALTQVEEFIKTGMISVARKLYISSSIALVELFCDHRKALIIRKISVTVCV